MLNDPDPDVALMLRVKGGDEAAFAELVDKYKQPVKNLVWRIIRDPVEAEDVAQNVFLQVFKSASRYEASARFSTWLFTIARNLALNEIRRRTRQPADSLEGDADDAGELPARQLADVRVTQPSDSALHTELERKIEMAMDELPENQRTAILLCRRDDLSYEEIAKILGSSLSATKSMIHRGRETLKVKLKPYLKSGQWK